MGPIVGTTVIIGIIIAFVVVGYNVFRKRTPQPRVDRPNKPMEPNPNPDPVITDPDGQQYEPVPDKKPQPRDDNGRFASKN